MRALVVGLGSIGRRHARNWVALGLGEVWVCRRASAPLPEPLGLDTREFSSLDDALDAGPDVVLVTNPTSLHVATARAAIGRNIHVFVEKPLGASLSEMALLVREVEAAKASLSVGYQLRFHPLLARLRALLRSGAIGRPVSLRGTVGEYLPDWHPREDYRHSYSARKNLGGGPILTFSHDLDLACWLLGPPTQLMAMTSHASALEIETEDVADVLLRFPDGALGAVHLDYVRRPPRRALEVVGEEGVLRWEYEENRLLAYAPATGQWRVEQGDPRFTRNDLFLAELRALARRVRGGAADPLPDQRQGAAVAAIALAALWSAEHGRHVDLTHPDVDPSPAWSEVPAWLTSLSQP